MNEVRDLGILIQLINLYTVVYVQFSTVNPLIPVYEYSIGVCPFSIAIECALLSNYVVNNVTIACVRDYSCVQTLLSYGQYTMQQKDFSNWGGGNNFYWGASAPPCPMLATPHEWRSQDGGEGNRASPPPLGLRQFGKIQVENVHIKPIKGKVYNYRVDKIQIFSKTISNFR